MRGNLMSHKVKPLSSTTHKHEHTHTHIDGLLTLVPLELPNFSSKLHCSFAACTEMEEGESTNTTTTKTKQIEKERRQKEKIHDRNHDTR